MNMKKDIDSHVNALKVMANKAVTEMVEIKNILDGWGSEAFRARIANDAELKEILLNQLNELIAPQKINTFDDAISFVEGMAKRVTEEVIEVVDEIPIMISFSAMMGIDRMCPTCHGQIDPWDEFCPGCGQHLGAKMPYKEPTAIEMTTCSCGRRHHLNDKFCPSCGAADDDSSKPSSAMAAYYKEKLQRSH